MRERLTTTRVIAVGAAVVLALTSSEAALGTVPAKTDSFLTAYVRQHQPWLVLQQRGVERFSDGDPADTSFLVLTTMAPGTDHQTAVRACEAVAADLRTLHLPLSLSILSRPEATMAADTSNISCTGPIGGAGSGAYFVVSPG